MLTALLSTFLWSISWVFWKKSMVFWIKPFANSIASLPIPIIFIIYFIVNGFSFNAAELITVWVIVLIVVLDIIKDPVNQSIFKEEKISVLIPYQNLNRIFVIISSFFIFHDVSRISFFITLFTILVIILASFDFKHRRLPRNFWKILFVEIVLSIAILLWWWVVLNYGEIMYFMVYAITWAILYLVLSIQTKQIYDLKPMTWSYWITRWLAAFWWISWFLSLVVIKHLWLSISILLWFVGIWVTLLISYMILGDRPSRKDIILTVIVSLLIGTWYYFK